MSGKYIQYMSDSEKILTHLNQKYQEEKNKEFKRMKLEHSLTPYIKIN